MVRFPGGFAKPFCRSFDLRSTGLDGILDVCRNPMFFDRLLGSSIGQAVRLKVDPG